MIHIIGRVGGSRPRTRSQPMIRRPNVEIDHDDSALNTVLRQSNTIPATQSSIQALHKFTLQQHSVEECIICMEEFLVGSGTHPYALLACLSRRLYRQVGESDLVFDFDLLWRPPPAGVIKINVDAAFLPDSATIAAVAMNELDRIE
uniref:Uncharacterized protein n=1 Tax=Fagus sylvatica TaxID=28930 RepID=A0A2N9IDK1_FAGSY